MTTFPNIPDVPGVPPIARQAGAALDTLSGLFTGQANLSNGNLAGLVVGTLSQASGVVQTITGALRGVVDLNTFQFSGSLSGPLSGTIKGILTATSLDGTTGTLSGALSASISNIAGKLTNGVLTSDAPSAIKSAGPQYWGIYDHDGAPVIVVDSVVELDFRKESDIPEYPVEKGAFESYNKVERPYEATISMNKGGSSAERKAFLDTLETLRASTDTYQVVMPEKSYHQASVVDYDFDRASDKGAGLITARVRLKEVRSAARAAFTLVKSASAAATQDTGQVQTQTPTKSQAAAMGTGPQ